MKTTLRRNGWPLDNITSPKKSYCLYDNYLKSDLKHLAILERDKQKLFTV